MQSAFLILSSHLFIYECDEYPPIIIQDLNDIFVHSQKFFCSTKKIVHDLFLLLILPNIVHTNEIIRLNDSYS